MERGIQFHPNDVKAWFLKVDLNFLKLNCINFIMKCEKVEGICIADENAKCDECELNGQVLCHFSKEFANKFLWGNILYRTLGTFITILAGYLTGQWWMLPTYIIAVLVTFSVIEPRLLCCHCPHYAKEGKVLKCWALRGMSKLWKYRPEPINETEKNIMLLVGGFIDLFPFITAGVGIFGAFIVGIEDVLSFGMLGLLIVLTVAFTVLVWYFDKFLRGGTCKKCLNFSCAMNKTSEEIREKFFQKSPTMANAWK